MKRFFILSAYFLSACSVQLDRSDCVTTGTECPVVARERITAVTCECVCSSDALLFFYGEPMEERVRTCLPAELNMPLAGSADSAVDVLEMSEPEYFAELEGWCSSDVVSHLQNIAEGLSGMCGAVNCDCTADVSTVEELESCETPCDTVHCGGSVCPKAIFNEDNADVDLESCACSQSDYCGRDLSAVICRPDIMTDP